MHLTLSWDLFIIVFFAIVVTYTFIIGKKESTKIIVSSYIALVAVQGVSNVFSRLFGVTGVSSVVGFLGLGIDTDITAVIKLVVFVTIVVFLAVKGGFQVEYGNEGNMAINLAITALCGIATAGLLLSILLTYIAGVTILDPALAHNPALVTVMQQSTFMKMMVENQDLLFTLPGIVLIASGFFSNR
jgi:hypothetical protein